MLLSPPRFPMPARPPSVHSLASSTDSEDCEENYVAMVPNMSTDDPVCKHMKFFFFTNHKYLLKWHWGRYRSGGKTKTDKKMKKKTKKPTVTFWPSDPLSHSLVRTHSGCCRWTPPRLTPFLQPSSLLLLCFIHLLFVSFTFQVSQLFF